MVPDLLSAIRAWLIAQGVKEPIYLQFRPSNAPDRCILLHDYGDAPGPHWATDGRLQVLVRGPQNDVLAAKTLAEQVHALLYPPGAARPHIDVTVGGSTQRLLVDHLSGPFPLGQDSAGRFEFSTNYRLRVWR